MAKQAENQKEIRHEGPEIKFHVGDLVQLKSGGPTMTVNRGVGIDEEEDYDAEDPDKEITIAKVVDTSLTCVWFAGDKLMSGDFEQDSLMKVDTKRAVETEAKK